MLVLDTDHISEYQKGASPRAAQLRARVRASPHVKTTTIITIEEVMRGWMAQLRRLHDPHAQISVYVRLGELFGFFATWKVLQWDDAAADRFSALKSTGVRIGTMDLKIASICLVHGATLLTRNRRDFDSVPGLTVEDWLT